MIGDILMVEGIALSTTIPMCLAGEICVADLFSFII